MHHCGEEDIDHLAGLGAGEAHSRHTHDLVDASARKVIGDAEGSPDDLRILCKTSRPVIVRHDGNRMGARLEVVVLREQAT